VWVRLRKTMGKVFLSPGSITFLPRTLSAPQVVHTTCSALDPSKPHWRWRRRNPPTDINYYLEECTFTNIIYKMSTLWRRNKTHVRKRANGSACCFCFLFPGPLGFQLVPSFLRLCYWSCGARWPCTPDLSPDCRGLNFYASATLTSNLGVRGSRVRRNQVFGEVNVLLPADWEREVSIC